VSAAGVPELFALVAHAGFDPANVVRSDADADPAPTNDIPMMVATPAVIAAARLRNRGEYVVMSLPSPRKNAMGFTASSLDVNGGPL
jgi:hypothetical protein